MYMNDHQKKGKKKKREMLALLEVNLKSSLQLLAGQLLTTLFQGFICTTDFELHINSKTISVLIIHQFLNESAQNFEALLKAVRAQGEVSTKFWEQENKPACENTNCWPKTEFYRNPTICTRNKNEILLCLVLEQKSGTGVPSAQEQQLSQQ